MMGTPRELSLKTSVFANRACPVQPVVPVIDGFSDGHIPIVGPSHRFFDGQLLAGWEIFIAERTRLYFLHLLRRELGIGVVSELCYVC